MKSDEYWMQEALKEAHKAYRADEVPIGAVLVLEDRKIAAGHNQVELLKDATAHAEMLCITSGSEALQNWRLAKTTLYCTVEPCTMCAGALMLARVPRLVWGAKDIRHGAHGSLFDFFSIQHPTHKIDIQSGVLEGPCSLIIQEFFQNKRKKND